MVVMMISVGFTFASFGGTNNWGSEDDKEIEEDFDIPERPSKEPETEAPSKEPETEAPTKEPETEAPTKEPETEAPTKEPETEAPTKEPETEAPTKEPETEAPTKEPETEAPTKEPETEVPTKEPETEPSKEIETTVPETTVPETSTSTEETPKETQPSRPSHNGGGSSHSRKDQDPNNGPGVVTIEVIPETAAYAIPEETPEVLQPIPEAPSYAIPHTADSTRNWPVTIGFVCGLIVVGALFVVKANKRR